MSDCKALVKPEMLVAARERAGLSAAELADKLGVGLEVMSWESGGEISVTEATAFAEACGVGLGWLFLPEPPAPVGPLELQEALEVVLDWAREGIFAEEQMRGGREAFIRRHGERDYEALDMVEIFVKERAQ